MNIFYCNHYASPPSNGGSGRSYYFAKELQSLGHNVVVICASQHHMRATAANPKDLNKLIVDGGVTYLNLRVRSYKGNGLRRLLNVLDYASQLNTLMGLVSQGVLYKPDILIASSPTPFIFAPARKLSSRLDAKLIYEVRDLWPLSLVALGNVSRWHPLVIWMNYIEIRSYKQSDAVVSLLSNSFEHMHIRGLANDKFNWVPNGVSVDEWKEMAILPAEHQELYANLRSRGKKIVVYAGSHAPSDGLEQLLDVKKVLGTSDPPYHIILIGDGISKQALMERTKAEQCTFINFLPKVTKVQSLTAIRQADICYIGWQNTPIYRYGISPNKLSEYMYAQKPVVHAVPETIDPVKEANAGISVKPFDPVALDSALRTLCAMSAEQRDELGKNGRKYVLENMEWSMLARKYEAIMKRLLKAC
jgi:glycosyltransferase involved in cell wall biosynthesis